jgi:hypothetical protein
MTMTKTSATLAAVAVSFAACVSSPPELTPDGQQQDAALWITPSPDVSAGLGWAWDEETSKLGRPCVAGNVSINPLERSVLDFQSGLTATAASSFVGTTLSARARYGLFKAGAESNSLRWLVETDTNLVFAYRMIFEKDFHSLINDGSLELLVAPGGVAWRNGCGTGGITGKRTGGQFVLALVVHAATTETKQEVRQALGAQFDGVIFGGGAGVTLTQALSKFAGDITVELHALQTGGEASDISKIIGGATETGDALGGARSVVRCTQSGDLASCEDFLVRALDYASSEELRTDLRNRPVDLGYETQTWREFGVTPAVIPNLELFKARLALSDLLDENLTCFDRSRERRAVARPSHEQLQRLQALEELCESNLERLDYAVTMCFDLLDVEDPASTAACLDAVSEERLAEVGYTAFDDSVLDETTVRASECPASDPHAIQLFVDEDRDGFARTSDEGSIYVCDGFSRLGFATKRGDSCDIDARTYPAAPGVWSTPNACGSFDYNSDGVERKAIDYAVGVCSAVSQEECASSVRLWQGAVPSCGQTGTWMQCGFVVGSADLCAATPKQDIQECN